MNGLTVTSDSPATAATATGAPSNSGHSVTSKLGPAGGALATFMLLPCFPRCTRAAHQAGFTTGRCTV